MKIVVCIIIVILFVAALIIAGNEAMKNGDGKGHGI